MTKKNRIEVRYLPGIDSRGKVIARKIMSLMEEGVIKKAELTSVDVIDSYSINKELDEHTLNTLPDMLRDNVTQEANTSFFDNADYVLEIGFKPGVTDNIAMTVRKGLEDRLGEHFREDESVHSSQVLVIGGNLDPETVQQIGEALANPLIQNISFYKVGERDRREPYIPRVVLEENPEASIVPISDMRSDILRSVAKKGIIDPKTGAHRGPLALDIDGMLPMTIIREYFENEGRDPTDVELECLAQTWSEHCKHTIFAAALDMDSDDQVPDGLYKTYIKGATEDIRKAWKEEGKEDWLLSVFHDNSGILKFNDKWAITDKVETHNSPSALDPYGGSITGIVGVDRDAIGAGLGAMPYSHRFFFCFADPKSQRKLFKGKDHKGNLTNRILSPRNIMDGVIEGVKDGGNKSGIPTPQGGAFFHEHYGGKPLVFVGVQGLLPLESAGRISYEKKALPGDLVVMVGGRVGLDGIHGATFSSESMDSGSPSSAVQIGDPITQKKLSDAIVKEARDKGLYNSITDNGAGGLSCSVYEMAKECGGAHIDIDKIPLKYPGMRPDQILISESQERMTLAVPPEKWDDFKAVMDRHDVEATIIGEFNDSGRATAEFRNGEVMDVDLDFLHDGLPQRELNTTYTEELYEHEEPDFPEPDDLTQTLHDMLSRLNICSKEFIFEQFDHEVQGGSVVKPMVGPGKADSDATVTRPVLDSRKGVVSTQALCPRYSMIDTYEMAMCAIDTAIRNMIAAGGTLEKMALLDNFCWCSSDEPERLGQLKRAAEACYDAAVAYRTPFISGKDSMFNTFKGFDEQGNPVKIDVPPTLLISGLSIIDDVRDCQTLDAKVEGDRIYVVGMTKDELGGSEYFAMMGEQDQNRKREYIGNNVPEVDELTNLNTYTKMQAAIRQGLVASCTSVGIGGLGIALAKTAIGGQLGMEINLDEMYLYDAVERDMQYMDSVLFSESQGRFVVTVDPEKVEQFEELMSNKSYTPYSHIGKVTDDRRFTVFQSDDEPPMIDTTVNKLTESYKSPLREY
ncbi:MAG: AIR synthase-related protein [Candidatus Woesearchaeota archaeon]